MFTFPSKAFDEFNQQNVIVSPFSVESALRMVYVGARGNTASEMEKVLEFDEKTHMNFQKTMKGLQQVMTISNAMWPNIAVKPLKEFSKTLENYYNAACQPLAYGTPKARKIINEQIAEDTKGTIPELIKTDDTLPADTVMTITNAIYLKLNWFFSFDEMLTKKDTWWYPIGKTSDSDRNECEMMFMQEACSCPHRGVTESDFGILKMPYKNTEMSMFVLLPSNNTMAELDHLLTPSVLEKVVNMELKTNRVRIELPKFDVRFGTNMVPALKSMGLTTMFDQGTADLSGITGSRNVFVSDVITESFMEVNESGTIAGAATAAIMLEKGCMSFTSPDHFVVNRPFVFMIYDHNSKNLLFAGRILQPDCVTKSTHLSIGNKRRKIQHPMSTETWLTNTIGIPAEQAKIYATNIFAKLGLESVSLLKDNADKIINENLLDNEQTKLKKFHKKSILNGLKNLKNE